MSHAPGSQKVHELWSSEGKIYGKWYFPHRIRTAAMTEALVQAAMIKSGMKVIDVACGPGEPAMTIAEIVGSKGEVVATDISEKMLSTAREIAAQRSISNIMFEQADAHKLPFDDCTFDAATCRLGAMYFSNLVGAMTEIHRVLKNGSRISLITWGPFEKNPYWLCTLGVVLKHSSSTSKYHESVDPFCLADPELLRLKLDEAGFEKVNSELIAIPYPWPGTPEEAWEWFSDTSGNLGLFDTLSSTEPNAIRNESIQALYRHYNGKRVEMQAVVALASGMKDL